MIFFRGRSCQFYFDGSPPTVWIVFGGVAEGIEMADILADGSEGLLLTLPTFGKVDFSAGGLGHALKYGSRNRILFGFVGADYIDGNSFRLGQLTYIFRSHHAGRVRTVGEDHHNLSAGTLASIFERE